MTRRHFHVKNAETGIVHRTVAADSQAEALLKFAETDDEHLIEGAGRVYLTGLHGVCYIAEEAP